MTIFRYSACALAFGLCVGAAFYVFHIRIPGRRVDGRQALKLAMVVYLAAVTEIIGLRLGLRPIRLLGGAVRLQPMRTTLAVYRRGFGAFIYHIVGNLMWFVPLGALLRRLRPGCHWWQALFAGAALSACLEALQYLLGTGICDIDDWLLNALGALVGWFANHPRQHHLLL